MAALPSDFLAGPWQTRASTAALLLFAEGFEVPPAMREDKGPSRGLAAPTTPPPLAARNAPCPCGSGKKYKKCCRGGG